MDHPYYTVTVTSVSRGWSYSAVEGDTPDPADDVVLTDALEYAWAFDGEQIPGQLAPSTAKVALAARIADDVPEVQIGDLIQLDVRIGTSGPRVIKPPPMRVASAEVTLRRGTYKAALQVALTDLSVDWRDRALIGQAGTSGVMRRQWRERFAEYGYLLGLSVGCPTTWGGTTRPPHPFDVNLYAAVLNDYGVNSGGYPFNAFEGFSRTLNAHQPNGQTHTAVTVYAPSGHPTGYDYVGPSSWSPSDGQGPITEPPSSSRIELVPAGRTVAASAGLPLTLTVTDGVLTLTPRQPPSGNPMNQLGLDAGWCVLPATARRSREAAINQVIFAGQEGVTSDDGSAAIIDDTYAYTDPDALVRGISARQPPMDLHLGGNYTDSNPYPVPWPAVLAAAPYFISDPAALASAWTYDAFELRSSLIPQDVATWLLTMLAPRTPGETDGDGRLVRNITLFDIAENLRFAGAPVTGFITAGALTIAAGEMTWQLRTAPGRPIYTGGTPSPVTFAEFETAAAGLTQADVDPLITFADLDYVDS